MSKKSDIKDIYSLSPMQEGILFHSLLDNSSESYFVQAVFEIAGELDVEKLEKSLNLVIERYDILRTIFIYEGVKQPLQFVLKERKTSIHYTDISQLGEVEKKDYIEKYKGEDKERGFKLSKDMLIRMSVIKLGDKSYKVIWSFHHIIMDGWCLGIITGDLLKLYYALKNDKPVKLPATYPYSNFIRWIEAQKKENADKYWVQYLEGYETQTRIPRAGNNKNESKYVYEEAGFVLNKEETDRLKEIAKVNKVSLNTVFQGIWGIILQKYNNVEDVVFGAVVSGRPAEVEGIEDMLGLFINTVPVRIKANGEEKFSEVLKRIHDGAAESKEYELYPLADIQSKSALRHKLLDHIIVFENYPVEEEIKEYSNSEAIGFVIRDVEMFEQTNYDFNIIVSPGEELGIKIGYNTETYDRATIEDICRHIRNATRDVSEDAKKKLSQINILDEKERYKLLYEFNDTYAEYPEGKTIHELFGEQAERTPDKVAVVYEDQQLTYRELNRKANQLARVLREKGAEPEQIIGIMLDKSLELVVGILGILKAGGAYLPIDPEYPADRIRYMLEDSRVDILLTQKQIREKIAYEGRIIELDDNIYEGVEDSNLENVNKPTDLLYTIYTSGSTGKPKGIMLEHRNLVNLICFELEKTNIAHRTKVLQYTTISFDVCYQEIFSTLLSGGELHIISSEKRKDVKQLFRFIETNGIETVFLPTALLKHIMGEEYIYKLPENIKHIITAGEQLVVTKAFYEYLSKKKVYLHNHYGPAETHVVSTYTIGNGTGASEKPPIGKPINNTRLYVLDKYSKPVPIGIAGELCIAGACVGRGYLNRPELTADKFVENPFAAGERIYRTGDMARWLPDGNLEFIGRIDHQVKIRGFRIELGEIESQLLKHGAVKEAVVIAKEGLSGDKYLCAYIAADGELKVSDLREHLSKELPGYMIPSYFVQLDKIPLTPNGKVDRKALPEPDESMTTGVEYEAPRNEIEEKLVKIWQEVLAIEKIGINDSFFELGGHSLKATSMTAKIHKELNVEVPLKEIFKTPSIKGIAEYISGQEESIYAAIEKAEEKDYYDMSSAQKRLYTLQQFDRKSTGYNMPGIMEIEGKLDEERLQAAFRKLIERHETLRTSFELVGEEIVQKVYKEVTFGIERLDNQISTEAKEFIRPFDLSKAPLLRVGLIKLHPEKHILMYDMHHIISDGMSMGIVVEEFAKLYEGVELAELRLQYKDYAAWQNNMLKSDTMKKQEEYWLKQLSGCASTVEVPALELLADYPRPELQSFEGGSVRLELDEALTKSLRHMAKETGATIYMILLAGFNILLSKCSGQEDIIVGTPIAGRQHAELEKIIGMFANTLAMRNYPCENKTFKEFLQEVKANALKAYENQDYQFEELVDKLNIKRDMSRNPIFDIMFVVQNMQMKELEIEGLKFKSREGDSSISRFDMTVQAVEAEEKINMGIQYSSHLFKKETVEKLAEHLKKILTDITNDADKKISEIEIFEEEEKKRIEGKRRLASNKRGMILAAAATFTAEPIEEYVKWWCGKYGEKIEIKFAPYNQVFQQLLNAESVISANKGINLLLIRFEDWIRDTWEDERSKCELLESNYNKLIELMENTNKNVLHIIGIFPVSTHLGLSDEAACCIERLNNKWQEAMARMDNVSVIDFRETAELYGIKEVFDPIKDNVGHMPFSDEYYAAIGTLIARRINTIKGNPFKVIAVDCDNTLWKGICGEDGALGVKVEEPYMEFHKQLIKMHDEGMLIALCSKNNEADVWEVFDKNPQMLLKKEHLAAWKINWEPKPENIRKLAEELNLGIDSFIFIDDSGIECSDMMVNNPQVLTLQLPECSGQIPMYLKHIWAFDKAKVTEEDKVRTRSYQVERQRKEIQNSYTMEDFIKELKLKININEIEKEHIARVSQLTQRTNQFNLSTIRRTEEEVEALLKKPGMKGWVIEVEDKFGDYGLTGAVIMEKRTESIYIDTLLLSCRVLGRRVEAAILSAIGNYCKREGIKKLDAAYYSTAKNQIVKEYLEKGKWNIAEENGQYTGYEIQAAEIPEAIEHIECSYGRKEKKDKPVEIKKGLECIVDHIGVKVKDIEGAKEYYKRIEYTGSDTAYDPLQAAYLALCNRAGYDTIELVTMSGYDEIAACGESDGIYHICYRVKSFTEVFERLKNYGIEWELISDAKPAVIFGGKEVLFIHVKGVGLVEFLQDSGVEDAFKEAAVRHDIIRMPVADKENALKYYSMLGYVEADRKYDGLKKVLSITLSRNGSGRIELLIATELPETHTDKCRICYEYDAGEAISSLTASDVTAEERYGSLNKAASVIQPREAKYSIYYSMDKEEKESIEMNWQLSMEKEDELQHLSYTLPIRYYTGKLLLSLPVYENEQGSIGSRVYEAPRNETEEKLVAIWQEVLQTEKIGINDNFFELGGHSIKATRVVSKLHRELNAEVSLREIFKYPTIKQLVENVLEGDKRERGLLNKLTKDSKGKELTLVCIPYGGGNSVVYQPFAEELSSLSGNIEIYSLALPGHDFGEQEGENKGIPELAEAYIEEIRKRVSTPIVLYGHCVGSALTCELARQLTINKLGLKAVVLGGVMPTKRTLFGGKNIDPFQKTTDRGIQEYLRYLGGFEEDMEDSELEFIMGNFRKDVINTNEYFYNYYPALKKAVKPDVPLYCIVGDKDPLTENYNKRYKDWKHYFAGEIYLKVVKEGKHYFIKYQACETAAIVKEIIDGIALNSD